MLYLVVHMASNYQTLKSDKVPRLNFQNQQSIGVYLSNFFGCNIHFRILKELGSTKAIVCSIEIIYPPNFYGIRVGIPRRVLGKGDTNAV